MLLIFFPAGGTVSGEIIRIIQNLQAVYNLQVPLDFSDGIIIKFDYFAAVLAYKMIMSGQAGHWFIKSMRGIKVVFFNQSAIDQQFQGAVDRGPRYFFILS